VWWPDATVGYFSGKHVILWIVAAIIFLAGLFYTILLLLWQWLLYYQHKFIFKWMQNQRLRMFVEPYHAPYAFKHRYWTGLLLLVRVTAYVISATDHADVSGDSGIILLAIGIIAIILLILSAVDRTRNG
jgi:Trk-type K+ transport system membrane component